MFHDVRDNLRSKPLIAAHRGVCGGNIPCNTLEAFDIALRQGADIIELDVSRSQDGKMYVFHPEMERVHLYSPVPIKKMESREVEHQRFVNMDCTRTQFHITRLEDALNHLRGRCYINVEKFYMHIPELARIIRDMNMEDQVIVKTFDSPAAFKNMEEYAADIPYMVVTRHDDFSADLCKRNLRYIGTEVLFEDDTHEMAQQEYVDDMHSLKLLTWVNAIVYDYREVLAGGHNDDISVLGNEADGWGWLIKQGFDIIQTDWTQSLKLYLNTM